VQAVDERGGMSRVPAKGSPGQGEDRWNTMAQNVKEDEVAILTAHAPTHTRRCHVTSARCL
jgi:hypothetical protein